MDRRSTLVSVHTDMCQDLTDLGLGLRTNHSNLGIGLEVRVFTPDLQNSCSLSVDPEGQSLLSEWPGFWSGAQRLPPKF